MKVGDLVQYMSRILLIVDNYPNSADGTQWVLAIECGETEIGKYRQSSLKVINESR